MADFSIINVCKDAIVDRLETRLKVMIDHDDPTWAGLVRGGFLQDDTAVEVTSVTVHEGKHKAHFFNDYRYNVAPYEAGGINTVWHMNFRVEFEFYFVGESVRDNARSYANVVLSRAIHAIQTMDVPPPRDSFGAKVIDRPIPFDAEAEEGGGTGDFIWTGVMNLAFIVQMEP